MRERDLQTFSVASDQAVDDFEDHEALRLYKDFHLHMRKYSTMTVKTCGQLCSFESLRLNDLNSIYRGERGELGQCDQALQCGDDRFRVFQFSAEEHSEHSNLGRFERSLD